MHLLVDEFQDTNLTAVRANPANRRTLPQHLRRRRPRPVHLLLALRRYPQYFEFRQDYPEAKIVLLEQNYRSTKLILEAAANLIAVNRERKDKGL